MAYYNKKDLVSDEQVFITGAGICPHCQLKVTRKGMPIAFKFFAKATVYVHKACREAFKASLP